MIITDKLMANLMMLVRTPKKYVAVLRASVTNFNAKHLYTNFFSF